MNAYDRAQELNMREIDEVQRRARMPDTGPAPEARDCDDCGNAIDRRRLQALPGTACCVRCAEMRERHGSQYRRRGG